MSGEFLDVLKTKGLDRIIDSFLVAASVERNVSTLLHILTTQTTANIIRHITKVFSLPMGLSTALLQLLQASVFQLTPGCLLLRGIYILAEKIRNFEFVTVQYDTGATMTAKVYPIDGMDTEIPRRCNQWISLGFHAHIVPAYYTRTYVGRCVALFTEQLDSSGPTATLAEHMEALTSEDTQPLTETTLRYIVSLCRAVEFCHLKGVAHLDLHPGNILLVPCMHGCSASDDEVVDDDRKKVKIMLTNFRVSGPSALLTAHALPGRFIRSNATHCKA